MESCSSSSSKKKKQAAEAACSGRPAARPHWRRRDPAATAVYVVHPAQFRTVVQQLTGAASSPLPASAAHAHHQGGGGNGGTGAAGRLLLLAAVPMRRRSSNRFSSGMAEATGGRWGRCTRSAWPGPTPMITSRRAHTPSAAGASRPPLVAMSAGIRRSPRTLASCKTRSTVKPHAKSPTSFVYLCLCLLF